jgi:prefoldin subunit 5
MSDTFEDAKEVEVLNEFMEQQQNKINQLQQQILLLTTKTTMLEKELAKVKNINSQYKEQIEKLTKVDRKSLSNSLKNNNRGVRNGISN